MPLHIIRQDITRIRCDAIVNAANPTLLGGGGVDGAIHLAAGEELLRECRTLGGCKRGEAKITGAYRLPCKYVIHTVGPVWEGGGKGEERLLKACYRNSLSLAEKHHCESVAFPLISSGVYGYPVDRALDVAVSVIGKFLTRHEMTVYVTVFDKEAYRIGKELYEDVAAYIDDNYADGHADRRADAPLPYVVCAKQCLDAPYGLPPEESLEEMLSQMDDNFAVTLLRLIDVKGITEVECYKKANVSKQTWYKIMNEKNYKPSKNTAIAFAIALKLTLEETNGLLATVGFTLSRSSKFDIIIEYFLRREEYDIYLINETLFRFDQPCLGV